MPIGDPSFGPAWALIRKPFGLAVFVLQLAAVHWLFGRAGREDQFKRYVVLIIVVAIIPVTWAVLIGAERLAIGPPGERQPLSPGLKVALVLGAVAAVALAIFNAW